MARTRLDRDEWRRRVERWKDSGLTAKEFAAETGINAGNIGEGAAVALFMLPLLAVVVIGMLVFARRAEVT